ncbi:methyltransferase domain-containing protein [Rhodomicrobium vannielii ATCC 17100]|uniref:protein-L-isoaspartate O-methyltransferase family protein n=1 Tax=Rhodomicrobium vannielii TaxID=1069 RepID=UPI00191A46C7|nr:methyltransferase domain-containing protein [Rhodomicrobium vannielii]MBJ7535246.1 methyltransferase domain-containing protein [Rhodomicrobium vannielii ATCC 17100]
MEASRTAKLRAFFALYVTKCANTSDAHIEEAFASVPREPFAGPGPWQVPVSSPWRPVSFPPTYVETPDDDPAFLYQNTLIALDAKRGLNIGEPSLHARCLDAIALQPGETVLQIGAGSGYYTAILAYLVGPEGRVIGFEIDPDLAARAKANLEPWPQASIEARSGADDELPEADAIYVNAGITQPCAAWLHALRHNGRLLFPLQPENGFGGMLLVQKPAEGGSVWAARFVSRAVFVACQARQDQEKGQGLVAAFSRGDFADVKSLRLDDTPDDTCWFNGGDWWLSTQAPDRA